MFSPVFAYTVHAVLLTPFSSRSHYPFSCISRSVILWFWLFILYIICQMAFLGMGAREQEKDNSGNMIWKLENYTFAASGIPWLSLLSLKVISLSCFGFLILPEFSPPLVSHSVSPYYFSFWLYRYVLPLSLSLYLPPPPSGVNSLGLCPRCSTLAELIAIRYRRLVGG